MTALIQDVRFAVRSFRRSPAFTVTVLLTMALSIAAIAALASVLDATLWSRLPYTGADRIVSIKDVNLRGEKSNGIVAVARTADLQALQHDGHPVFTDVSFYYANQGVLAINGHPPQPTTGAAVNGSFFDTMATAPLLGRTLTPADDVPKAPIHAVLSYRLWQASFGGDPNVIGSVARLGDAQATIVGVMGPKFDVPAGFDLWYNGGIFASNFGKYRGGGSRFLNVVARLDPHESIVSARAATNQLAAQLAQRYPESDAAWGFSVTSLRDSIFGDYRQALLLISAAAVIVLLAVAINIAGLQLARNAARQQEFAIRGALGITRVRLLRQLLTENLTLTSAGALLGLGLAAALLRVLTTQLPPGLLRVDQPHLDARAVATSLLVSALVAFATGIVPWLQSNKHARSGPGVATARATSVETRRFGKWFGAVQVALALVLLTTTAAVVRSLYGLLHQSLGYDAARVQTFTVDLPWSSREIDRHQLYATFERQVTQLPGVESAGAMIVLPLSDFSARWQSDVLGQPLTLNHDRVTAESRTLTPGLLSAMRIPLLAGRSLTEHDANLNFSKENVLNPPPFVLVNRAFAERYFGSVERALNQHLIIKTGIDGSGTANNEIVGVIGDITGTGGSLSNGPQPEVYSAENGGWPHMQFAVRTTLPAAQLEQQVRKLVGSFSTTASVSPFVSLTSKIDTAEAQPKLNAELLTLFAAFAVLLVMVGVYGLAAFALSQRGREFAIRMALGSSRDAIWSLVVGDSARMLTAGLLVGTALSLTAARVLRLQEWITGASTALPLMVAAGLLTIAAFSAVLLPARRAANIEPAEALRAE